MTTPTFFTISIDGPIAHLRLNRPDKANGMNEAFWSELPLIIEELDENPSVRALIISGEGKHFSSGIDFSTLSFVVEVLQAEPSRAAFALRKEIAKYQQAFTALEKARFPVVVAIWGVCMGAAVDLITACDLRVAASNSIFSIEEVNIGMAADVGTLQRLPKLIAPGIAKELAFTGRRFSADEALNWGLVNSVHEDSKATMMAALELAKQIASKSPVAIAGIKHAINYAQDHTVSESLEQIATWNAGMLRMNDLKKSIDARNEGTQSVFDDMLDAKAISNI